MLPNILNKRDISLNSSGFNSDRKDQRSRLSDNSVAQKFIDKSNRRRSQLAMSSPKPVPERRKPSDDFKKRGRKV
jgi:hypothetical protein